MIETNRLILRKIVRSDINEDYIKWLNDPEVNKYLETRFQRQTKETVERYWRTQQEEKDSCWLAMCDKDMVHIGNIKLGPIDLNHRKQT